LEDEYSGGQHAETDEFTSPLLNTECESPSQKKLIGHQRGKRQRILDDIVPEVHKKKRQRVSASVNVFNVAVKSP
jgi:hypothetical protein